VKEAFFSEIASGRILVWLWPWLGVEIEKELLHGCGDFAV